MGKLLFVAAMLLSNLALADGLIVYGKGFSFAVSEPSDWTCECDGVTAAQIQAKALLYQKGQSFATAQPLPKVSKDAGENLILNLWSVDFFKQLTTKL